MTQMLLVICHKRRVSLFVLEISLIEVLFAALQKDKNYHNGNKKTYHTLK